MEFIELKDIPKEQRRRIYRAKYLIAKQIILDALQKTGDKMRRAGNSETVKRVKDYFRSLTKQLLAKPNRRGNKPPL